MWRQKLCSMAQRFRGCRLLGEPPAAGTLLCALAYCCSSAGIFLHSGSQDEAVTQSSPTKRFYFEDGRTHGRPGPWVAKPACPSPSSAVELYGPPAGSLHMTVTLGILTHLRFREPGAQEKLAVAGPKPRSRGNRTAAWRAGQQPGCRDRSRTHASPCPNIAHCLPVVIIRIHAPVAPAVLLPNQKPQVPRQEQRKLCRGDGTGGGRCVPVSN